MFCFAVWSCGGGFTPLSQNDKHGSLFAFYRDAEAWRSFQAKIEPNMTIADKGQESCTKYRMVPVLATASVTPAKAKCEMCLKSLTLGSKHPWRISFAENSKEHMCSQPMMSNEHVAIAVGFKVGDSSDSDCSKRLCARVALRWVSLVRPRCPKMQVQTLWSSRMNKLANYCMTIWLWLYG